MTKIVNIFMVVQSSSLILPSNIAILTFTNLKNISELFAF